MNEEPVVIEKKRLPVKIIVFGTALLLGGIGLFITYQKLAEYREVQKNLSSGVIDEEAEKARMLDVVKNLPRTFLLVPDARDRISLPPPTPYDQDDLIGYQFIKRSYEGKDLEALSQEHIFSALTPAGVSIESILFSPRNQKFFQAQSDEINNLVLDFNEKYPEKPLYEVFPEVTKIGTLTPARYGASEISVYPSVYAATAYLVARVMTSIEPENESFYTEMAEEYAKRGIAFGWYDEDSKLMSKFLVDQYRSFVVESIASTSTNQ